jgi:aspartate racemase
VFRSACLALGDSGHPRVSLHGEPFEHYVAALLRDDWHTVGELLIKSAKALASLGCDFCLTPDNVIQHGVHLAEIHSPLPWLKMTDLVANAVVDDGRKTVGLIGTKMVMFGSTYQTLLGLRGVKVIAPAAADAEAIDGIIFRELVHGVTTAESREAVVGAIARLAERGAEGVILGCSEAPLLIDETNSPIPVYDATGLLAEGAVRLALAAEPSGR